MAFLRSLVAAVTALLLVSPAQSAPGTPADWLRLAHKALCRSEPVFALEAQAVLPGAWLLDEDLAESGAQIHRVLQRFALPGGDELRIDRLQPAGRLRRFTVELHHRVDERLEPMLQLLADGGCRTQAARRIRRDGERLVLDQLEPDLETVRWTETLEAPWPEGVDPGGVRVALVDSGLAYDLPLFRDRLARDPEGRPIGYDFWDLDRLPYDGDVSRGPFLPIRHGTAVASVLARAAPTAALIPYRYPRGEMSRMSELVERAAAAGARIIAMPLGSRDPAEWTSFARALTAHPELLAIASAGNDGVDIEEHPIWPASLGLGNLLVVTSADGFGRLAEGSSWGATSVDIMLPAENVELVDFRGAKGRGSGSSYAVPLMAAIAVRMLEAEPELSVETLKARLLARATPSPYTGRVVSAGWIPDPLSD